MKRGAELLRMKSEDDKGVQRRHPCLPGSEFWHGAGPSQGAAPASPTVTWGTSGRVVRHAPGTLDHECAHFQLLFLF